MLGRWMGLKILCEISKSSHTILNPYTANHAFYEVLKSYIYYILELWQLKFLWDGPRMPIM